MPTIEQARTWYADSDPVHDFDHILRVYNMAERLGPQMGADMHILRAAALLHDAEGATPGGEGRKQHHLASAEFAERILAEEGWTQSASPPCSTASARTDSAARVKARKRSRRACSSTPTSWTCLGPSAWRAWWPTRRSTASRFTPSPQRASWLKARKSLASCTALITSTCSSWSRSKAPVHPAGAANRRRTRGIPGRILSAAGRRNGGEDVKVGTEIDRPIPLFPRGLNSKPPRMQ